MKRIVCIVLCGIAILLCVGGCGRSARYGGQDANGQTAADVVRAYYDEIDAPATNKKTYFSPRYEIENRVEQPITLIALNHCEEVSKDQLRESEREDLKELSKDYYACCYVQTADVVRCEKDNAWGQKGEEVSRQYMYILVMESKESGWKIYDCGYPPIYVPE
ncbi:MAG: hypothetical protein IJC33_06135 [Clostridia bacterium]|nr:hypothetical protein [Clostridia bacterium]